MNIYEIKNQISSSIGREVKVTVNGIRNKQNEYYGIISGCYPYIFTIDLGTEKKSFSYAEIYSKEVSIIFL